MRTKTLSPSPTGQAGREIVPHPSTHLSSQVPISWVEGGAGAPQATVRAWSTNATHPGLEETERRPGTWAFSVETGKVLGEPGRLATPTEATYSGVWSARHSVGRYVGPLDVAPGS